MKTLTLEYISKHALGYTILLDVNGSTRFHLIESNNVLVSNESSNTIVVDRRVFANSLGVYNQSDEKTVVQLPMSANEEFILLETGYVF